QLLSTTTCARVTATPLSVDCPVTSAAAMNRLSLHDALPIFGQLQRTNGELVAQHHRIIDIACGCHAFFHHADGFYGDGNAQAGRCEAWWIFNHDCRLA